MYNKFKQIIHHLINDNIFTEIDISSQFNASEKENLQSLNAAFLISLAGETHPLFDEAVTYINDHQKTFPTVVEFFHQGLSLIESEISALLKENNHFKDNLDHLHEWLQEIDTPDKEKAIQKIWRVFFPEAIYDSTDIDALRHKRKVSISNLNETPIQNPISELVITSNILLTLPGKNIDDLDVSPDIKNHLKDIANEKQSYWYDHPIQIGVDFDSNEAIYGLKGLNESIEIEKQAGKINHSEKLTCILSVSVTHKGLHKIAKQYLMDELQKTTFPNLNIYIFTEVETQTIINEFFTKANATPDKQQRLSVILGVDGEYGRHYSFLKAIAAFFQVFINPKLKGTFKIDLDQVFPQEELKTQTGRYAFENFKTPLWGAIGTDAHGNKIDLSMIAGSLVNEKDIHKSLFTPDVTFPDKKSVSHDEVVFFSKAPQALSTEAEMMTRYEKESPFDGEETCIHRIHVTGGTNGILINALRKYQPFTPTFIGRAEDQAYLLSVLFKNEDTNLRYLHQEGLIMRHDKEAFAGEAIKAASVGRLVGDLVRIILFSEYAKIIHENTKQTIDPFTGCFVSHIPFTIVYLRLTLKIYSLFASKQNEEATKSLTSGAERLLEVISHFKEDEHHLKKQFEAEQTAWKDYYAILSSQEEGLTNNDAQAIALKKEAEAFIETIKI